MKKRPVLLINSPYTTGTSDATNVYTKHIKNAITRLNPVAVLNIAPDNFLTGGRGENKKLRNRMKEKYGNVTYIRWLNKKDDWNKTIEIDTCVSIWDENTENVKTKIIGRTYKNKFDIELTDLIFPSETLEEYEYICSIQTTKKCTVKLFQKTGRSGEEVKLAVGNEFNIIPGDEYTSNNNMYRQVVGYMRTQSLADIPPGPSVKGGYRELVSDYSPTVDKDISEKFGRYMRSSHTRWLVELRYNTRSLDAPALSLVPMIDLNELPDNFTDQDLYNYFNTPQNVIDKIIQYGNKSPY